MSDHRGNPKAPHNQPFNSQVNRSKKYGWWFKGNNNAKKEVK